MDNKYLNEVLDRLENYQKMMRQIELLQYEIQYASHVTPTEMIEVLPAAFAALSTAAKYSGIFA